MKLAGAEVSWTFCTFVFTLLKDLNISFLTAVVDA